jgi:hypothetical protein
MTRRRTSGSKSIFATWPPQRSDEGDTYRIGDWGWVVVQSPGDETDILIEFDSSLEARSSALTFARALVDQVQGQQPGMHAEFVAARDHYHVRFKDFGSVELRAAHGLQALLTRRYAPAPQRARCQLHHPCCQRAWSEPRGAR